MSDRLDAALQDEAKRRDEVNRGERAKRILDDTLFKEAVEAVRDDIYGAFASSGIADDDARRIARLRLDVLNRVLKDLEHHMQTGELATEQLPAIQRLIKSLLPDRRNS